MRLKRLAPPGLWSCGGLQETKPVFAMTGPLRGPQETRCDMSRYCIPFPAPLGAARNWLEAGAEPALDDVLADPLVHLVMRRDGVSPAQLGAVVAAARARLGGGRCCRCAA